MAKIYLDASNTEYDVTNGNDSVVGLTGTQVVKAAAGVVGLSVDQNVERVTFTGQASDYTFLSSGNSIKVYNAAASTLVATVFVQDDVDGTQLTFNNGTANAILTNGIIKLGGATVDTTQAVHVTPTLDASVTSGTTTTTTTGSTVLLTTGQDFKTGSDFLARIIDNNNTLQTGDVLTGTTATTDTLTAYVGNSQRFAILAETSGIENVFIKAQATATDTSDNFNTSPAASPLGDTGQLFSYNTANHDGFTQIDAGEMAGVRQFWSDDSRANLVIEDVSVNSHLTTIGMRDTDPGNVNYEVYFDPQNITAPTNSVNGAVLNINLTDLVNLKTGGNGLSTIPYTGMTIMVGTTAVLLNVDFTQLASYTDLAAKITTALAAAGYSAITATAATARTAIFSDAITVNGINYNQSDVAGSYQPIVLTNTGSEVLTFGSYATLAGTNTGNLNLYSTNSNAAGSTLPYLTAVNVILDNVARGDASGSGDLVIGDMSESGIQQFNVQVDHSSQIDQLASTNNVLEVVNVSNIGANGNLIINSLNDVRVFDAATMTGSVKLNADLSSYVTTKYLNLTDTAANPATDNSEIAYANVVDTQFSYDLGAGNDTLSMTIDSSNLAAAGTSNREDFVLAINGGAGNDTITTNITGAESTAWYVNQKMNANMTVNGDAGNDTIKSLGAGDFKINAGTGDDTVYADNTGTIGAKWTINDAVSANLNDLQAAAVATTFMYNGKLTVTLSGALSGGAVTSGIAAALTNGFESTAVSIPTGTNYAVTQLNVNQAIKTAIINDPVLNKLLSVADGPASTLVITSKIDGAFTDADLRITVSSTDVTTLTAVDQSTVLSAYKLFAANSLATIATAQTANAAAVTALNLVDGMNTNQTLAANGTISTVESDNTINLGTGTDVAVLGTGAFSNDTIVFSGYDLGKNTIVNFNDGTVAATVSGLDMLNFSSYLTGKVSLSGSIESQQAIATTFNVNTTVEANSITVLNGMFTSTQSFAGLTAANLLAAVNSTNSTGQANYAGIATGTLDAVNSYVTTAGANNLVGGTGHGVVLVQNNLNLGEYAMFDLTFNGLSTNTTADFSAATFIGYVDFGNTISAATSVLTTVAPAGGAVAPVVPVTYTVTASPAGTTSINEGSAATFSVHATGSFSTTVPVNYNIVGTVTGPDFTGGVTAGSFTLDAAGNATITTPVLLNDTTTEGAGPEVLGIMIAGETLVAATINVVDSSQNAAPGTATAIVNATNVAPYDASTAAVTFNIASGTYTYTIDKFGTGDVLSVFASATVAVTPDVDNADGIQDLALTSTVTGLVTTIHLTGLTAAQDLAVFNTASFNSTFTGGLVLL